MAHYEYGCEDCGETFEVAVRISEHDRAASPPCPEYGSENTRQLPSPFFLDTSDKT